MHRDPYENMYAVIKGEKHFTLFPPSDAPFLESTREFAIGKYAFDSGKWHVVRDPSGACTPWIECDVESDPDLRQCARAARLAPHAVRARVCAGDVLYLPSLWFHRVAQSAAGDESAIAVNWWHVVRLLSRCLVLFHVYAMPLHRYDMQFDIKFAYFSFLKRLASVNK